MIRIFIAAALVLFAGSALAVPGVPFQLAPGTSVVNPGSGMLESALPVQTLTQASVTDYASRLYREVRRSNSGSAMTDTFPASSATGLVNGTRIVTNNVDTTSSVTITAGSGTTINSGATVVVGPLRSVTWVYDAPNTVWRSTLNGLSGLLTGGTGDVSNTTSVATGSAAIRSLAARGADVVNVRDFLALCDNQHVNTTVSMSAGSNLLTVGSALFSPGDPGKSIGIPLTAVVTGSISGNTLTVTSVSSGSIGVGSTLPAQSNIAAATVTKIFSGTGGVGIYTISGAAQTVSSQTINVNGGAKLSTTILSYVGPTQVLTLANSPQSISGSGLLFWGHDDSGPINAAANYIRNNMLSANFVHEYDFAGGECLALGGLNFTNMTKNPFVLFGRGSSIYGAIAGNSVFDASGSRYFDTNDLTIHSDPDIVPTTMFQFGRTNTTALNSSDVHHFSNMTLSGSATIAAFYNMNAEQSSYSHLQVYNGYPGGYSAVFDGINHFGLTSQFVTFAQPANTQQSFNSNTCYDCVFYAAGAPIWVAGTSGLKFDNSYANNTNPSSPDYCINLYSVLGSTINQNTFNLHCETSNGSSYSSIFFISGTSATPTIRALGYSDIASFAGASVFIADTNQTAISMPGLSLEISTFKSGSPQVFDTPALYAGYGLTIDLPSSASWNGTSAFPANPCSHSSGNCILGYALPNPLTSTAIAPTGSVTAITQTINGASYFIQTTNLPYTPTISIAAPPSGVRATATLTSLALNGFGTVSAGGTGYTNGDTCQVTDLSGNRLFNVTITASGGVISSAAFVGASSLALTGVPGGPPQISNCTTPGGAGGTMVSVNYLPIFGSGGISGGSGYTTAPAVTYSTFGAGGTVIGTSSVSNTFTATASNGALQLTNAGTVLGISGSSGFPVVSVGASIDGSGVRQALTGASFTIPANTSLVRFTQSGTIATQTVVLPTAFGDGQPITIDNYTGALTALTFSPSVIGWTNGSTLAPNTTVVVRWDAVGGAWHREQ